MFFDYLAIHLDSTLVEDLEFVANVRHPDTGEELVVELSNATLTTQVGFQAPAPDFTLTIPRAAFEGVLAGEVTIFDQIEAKIATLEGDDVGLRRLLDALVDFDLLFEIMPGTKT